MKEIDRHTQIQMRMDGLPDPVRAYLAIGEALRNTTLTIEERQNFKDKRVELLTNFSPEYITELAKFGEFLNKRP